MPKIENYTMDKVGEAERFFIENHIDSNWKR